MPAQVIDSINVWGLAKILGVMGFLWSLIIVITWTAAGILGAGIPGVTEVVLAIIGGVLYGVIGGAITAIIYNAAASLIGGVEIELVEP